MKIIHEARKTLGAANKTRRSQIKFLKVQIGRNDFLVDLKKYDVLSLIF